MAKKSIKIGPDWDFMKSDQHRARFNPLMLKHKAAKSKHGSNSLEGLRRGVYKPTEDCNTCPYSKNVSHKMKGIRISGSFGKCVRPGGPCCDNPVPRKGIGRAESKWKKGGD